jgi:uncharacterized protein YdeI (YjbR/CyaY-like superfamily)
MTRDPRIDAYIESRADFARPILRHLRDALHSACPEVEESIKWSMPAFTLKGRPFASMAAFKAHATFGFWQAEVVAAPTNEKAMGQFGRICSLADLPDDAALADLIRKAATLTADGSAPARKKPAPKPPAEPPEDFSAALAANPKALATFNSFPPSARREYVDWIVEAKRPETRASRIVQAVEWIGEGKRRHWRYESC